MQQLSLFLAAPRWQPLLASYGRYVFRSAPFFVLPNAEQGDTILGPADRDGSLSFRKWIASLSIVSTPRLRYLSGVHFATPKYDTVQ